MPRLAGAPRPLVRLLVGALLLVTPPLLVFTLLRVPPSKFPVLHRAPLSVGLRRRVRLGPGLPSVLCATALRRFAAYHFAAPGRSPAPSVLFLGRRAASCSCCSCGSIVAFVWARGAARPFVRPLVGALLPLAPPLVVAPLLCVLSFDVAMVPLALPRLRLRYRLSPGLWALLHLLCAGSWAPRCLELCRSRSLLGSARRPSWLPRCLVLRCSWGCAAPLPGLVGAPLPFMQLRVRASLPCDPLLSVAPLLCAPSFNVTVPPPALLLLRLRCCLCPSLQVPACP